MQKIQHNRQLVLFVLISIFPRFSSFEGCLYSGFLLPHAMVPSQIFINICSVRRTLPHAQVDIMTHRGRVSDGTFGKDVLIWVIYQLLAKPAFLYDRWNQCYEIILIRGPYWSKNFISCLDILRFHYTIPSPCFFILKYTIGLCLSHNMLSFLLIINTSL